MRLDGLLDEVDVRALLGSPAPEVSGITLDSRRVAPGDLYCCVRGSSRDGHTFAGDAVAAGAVALLVDHEVDAAATQVVVDDVRVAMGRIAAAFHDHPSRSMEIVGITGTNGKTTTTWLLRAILAASGRATEMIGTLTSELGAPPTTPDAIDLQARLAEMRDRGITSVAMEVSSHALAQSRVEGTRFRVAVFTNLSRDHLEFHETMEDYFAAKARLFEPHLADLAVVNADDPRGRLLLDAARIPTRSYSLRDVEQLEVGAAASTCTWRGHRLVVPLGGAFNVSNALGAATAALELGIDERTVVDAIAAVPQAPGRFERVDAGQPFTVVVDYAHTPDALDNLLREARAVTAGRLLVVFGAGGDKDRGKRPMMGEVVDRLADVVILTSDNPRSEDPLAIIEQIREGVRGDATVEPDRRAAIALALEAARPGDVVVIAGKGHETTQIIGDSVLPFSDVEVAREVLAR